jgi:hypothetical protein
MNVKNSLPDLPLEEWEATKTTLHLILQIIGKIRLKMTPRKNHWWYITQYISPRGITTGPIPTADGFRSMEITFNVHQSRIEIFHAPDREIHIPVKDGVSVAAYYEKITEALKSMDCLPGIVNTPFDMGIKKPFPELHDHTRFQADYVVRFWEILLWVDHVMKEFSGRFYGKTSPVQLYWHHLDLAVTRFSGNSTPPLAPEARLSDKDAYSHEMISFGFWAGDDLVREPAFYSYTYPSPDGIEQEPLGPSSARWIDSNGSPMAFLSYENLLKEEDPRKALLDFFESSYQAGAKRAGWDRDSLKVKSLGEL